MAAWVSIRDAQVLALEQLHRHVQPALGLAQVVDRDDVRMAEAADRLGLAVEALVQLVLVAQLRREHLEGDDAARLRSRAR